MEDQRRKNVHRRNWVWPIVLIFIGGIFLLNNLGLIDQVTWRSIWRLWPLIFVAIGLDGLLRRNEIAGPVFMIGLGGVFLLSNLGVLALGAWDTLWRLWPLIIVAFGLEIMVGRRSLWVSLLSVVLIFGLLFGFLWMADVGVGPLGGRQVLSEVVNQPLEAAAQAEVGLFPAVGDLDLSELAEGEDLIRGRVSVSSAQEVWADYKLRGDTAVYSLRSHNIVPLFGSAWHWRLALSPEVPIALEASMGAGDMDLDLSGLVISALEVNQGVGDLTVILPGSSTADGEINQAIGSIVVRAGEDIGLRLEVSKAISSLQVPDDFVQREGYYYSPGYEGADQRVHLGVSQAIGSIIVRYGE
jgi:hypothetical protein